MAALSETDSCLCSQLYEPLPPAQTRVVSIHSSEASSEFWFELGIVDLNDPMSGDFQQEYTALSYTWGDVSDREWVNVRCSNNNLHQVSITCSLLSALLELYRVDIKTIWVDQLSINQGDEIEKGVQITIMRDIYERATSVFVWLGEAGDNSDVAIERLRSSHQIRTRLSSNFRLHQPGASHLTRDALLQILETTSPSSQSAWRAVEGLIHRTWWGRAWIVQEATSVDERKTWLACGKQRINIRVVWTLRDIFFALATQVPPPGFEFLRQDVEKFDSLMTIVNFGLSRRRLSGGRPLLHLVSSIRPMQTTDLRDKIWCMQGFAYETDILTIGSTRTRHHSAEQLFIRFVVGYLSTHGDLDFLGQCSFSIKQLAKLPSWVPDWSACCLISNLSTRTDPDLQTSSRVFNASGRYMKRLLPTFTTIDLSRLRLLGIKVMQIGARIELKFDPTVEDFTSTALLKTLISTDRVYSPTGCTTDELVARTLVMDCRRIWHGNGWASQRIPATETYDSIAHWNFNPYQMRRSVRGRVLFFTKSTSDTGKCILGFGPEELQPEDEVWLLQGGNVLYVLRPALPADEASGGLLDCSNSQASGPVAVGIPVTRRFIGECFVHGLMDGEALGMLGENARRQRPSSLEMMDRSFRVVDLV